MQIARTVLKTTAGGAMQLCLKSGPSTFLARSEELESHQAVGTRFQRVSWFHIGLLFDACIVTIFSGESCAASLK